MGYGQNRAVSLKVKSFEKVSVFYSISFRTFEETNPKSYYRKAVLFTGYNFCNYTIFAGLPAAVQNARKMSIMTEDCLGSVLEWGRSVCLVC